MKLQTIMGIVGIKTKLELTSFGEAWKDYAIYKFVNDNRLAINKDFFLNEQNKMFDKWAINNSDGTRTIIENHIADYTMAINELLNMEITDFPQIPLSINDFEECKYAANREYWLCPNDFSIIENYIREQKKRED